jgi:hypothetical protein
MVVVFLSVGSSETEFSGILCEWSILPSPDDKFEKWKICQNENLAKETEVFGEKVSHWILFKLP